LEGGFGWEESDEGLRGFWFNGGFGMKAFDCFEEKDEGTRGRLLFLSELIVSRPMDIMACMKKGIM
jgi:hypothetical protein